MQMIPRPLNDPQLGLQMIPNEKLIEMAWTQVSGSLCQFYYYYKKFK